MPRRSPAASTVYSLGEPNPAISNPPREVAAASERPTGDLVQLLEQVSHPVALRAQVAHVLGVHAYGHGLTAADLESVPLQAGSFGWVVGEQSHAAYAEVV